MPILKAGPELTPQDNFHHVPLVEAVIGQLRLEEEKKHTPPFQQGVEVHARKERVHGSHLLRQVITVGFFAIPNLVKERRRSTDISHCLNSGGL